MPELSAHELKLMQEAFYTGAIAMCRILKHLSRRGETERMAKVIARTARLLRKRQDRAPAISALNARWRAALRNASRRGI